MKTPNSNTEILQSYPLVVADALLEIVTAAVSAVVIQSAFVTDKHFLCPEFCYQLVFYCFIWYFLARICIVKCFVNNSSFNAK
jgi:hypothetical protein